VAGVFVKERVAMKRAGIAFSLIMSLIMLLSPAALAQTSSASSHPDDDVAIKRAVAQYEEYWNRHEFVKTAELRTEDSENVNVVGQRSSRADIAKGEPSFFRQAFGNSTIHDTVISIKYLKPDVAAVDVAWEMTGAKCLDGSDAGFRVGLKSLVMTKVHGEWLIAIFHNMDLPTPADRGDPRTIPCQFR
jgi:uncharacterized protein (TIGR02246 family)